MPLLFPYTLLRVPAPLVTLGGRLERPRPLLTVTILGPTGVRVEQGLLDTGADDTVFPEDVADDIGLDLTNAPTGQMAGVGSAPSVLRYAQVTLRIAGPGELREWTTWVGFTSVALRRPLLGFAGFLQFFTATFRGDREEVELAVNVLYPGS